MSSVVQFFKNFSSSPLPPKPFPESEFPLTEPSPHFHPLIPVQNLRTQFAYQILMSFPHKPRKYERCSGSVHSIRVARKMHTETEVVVALLHDILEDFGKNALDKWKEFFTLEEEVAINRLTHYGKTDEEYFAYIQRLKGFSVATKVKIADLNDNLATASPKNITKYQKALAMLEGTEKEELKKRKM